ncbi:MAG: hypothetical protein AAGA93_24845 [Actinomycetota bacterium]
MSVCACGSSFDEGDRFCRRCGRPAGEQAGLVPLLEPHASVSTERVTSAAGRNPKVLYVVGAITVVLAVALVLATTGSSDAPGTDERTTPASEPSASVRAPPEEPQVATSPTSEPTSATTSGADTASSLLAARPGAPLLGTEVGYKLLVSTTGRPALIDLDRGTTLHVEGSRVFPIAVAGPWVVIDRATPGGLARLPLDDLAADPDPIFAVDGATATFVSSPSGQVDPRSILVSLIRQTRDPAEIDETQYVVDPLSGEAVERVDDELWLDVSGLDADPNNTLVTGPAGGVYTRSSPEDGYRQVADGRLLAADDQRALVQSCDSTLQCTLTWLDRRTWEPLDLHVPSRQAGSVVLLHGTDWLLESTFGPEARASLLNVATGATRTVRPPEFGFRSGAVLPAVSSDGQWLAEVTDQPRVIAITNLTTGETTEIELAEAATQPMFFIGD